MVTVRCIGTPRLKANLSGILIQLYTITEAPFVLKMPVPGILFAGSCIVIRMGIIELVVRSQSNLDGVGIAICKG